MPWLIVFALAGSLPAQSTIRLEDERVLERARIIGQGATTVTIAHAGGIAQVEKAQLPAELRVRYPVSAAPTAEERPTPVAPVAPALPLAPSPTETTAAPAQAPAPMSPVRPTPPTVSPFPTFTVTATYLWRDALGAAMPLTEACGFAVERATFLDWAARRRERFAAAGRRMLLEYVRAEEPAAREAARARLEEFVAKSVSEPPAGATRLTVNEHGQFSITAPAGRAVVVVMTATRKDGARVRYMTWFDLLDGAADRRISRDAIEASVGDWSFGE